MTTRISKKALITIISCSGAFVVLMIIAAFFDLQINMALSNPESMLGQFMEYLGDSPAYLAPAVAFIILYQSVTKENKFYNGAKIIFGILSFVGVAFFINFFMGKFFFEELMYKYLYLIVFTIFSTVVALFITSRIDKKLMKKLAIFAIIIIAALALSQLIVTVAKGMWGRLRFRNMNELYEGFTPWYKLNFGASGREALVVTHPHHPDEDAFKSFPSGHTAAAAISFCFVALPDIFENLKKYKIWFYIAPAIFTVLVAFSRILVEAHFLSDVLVGGAITVCSVFLVRWLILMLVQKSRAKKQGGV